MHESVNKEVLAYVIGVALGDGNLSNPNGRATRLRVTCDLKYPNIIKNICSSIQELLPENKVSTTNQQKGCLDISCYSNKWEGWLNWKVGRGSKYEQKVFVPTWIKNNKNYSRRCIRGLFETDGCIYTDRGYKMIGFVTIIPTLANDVLEMLKKLNFNPRCYKVKNPSPNRKTRYNIRLAKKEEVNNFIKEMDLEKS